MEPRLPSLPTPDLRRKFYGKSSTDDLIRKLLLTHDIARKNSEVASDEADRQFNKKAEPHAFLPDQLVLLDEHSFLAKNKKLAPKWSGPHKILRLKGDCNVELLLRHNNKKLITHVNCLKPYFVQKPAAVSSPDFFPAERLATPPPTADQPNNEEEIVIEDEFFPYEQEVIRTEPLTPGQLELASNALAVEHFLCRHLFMVTLQRSVYLTLPLLSSKHMLKSQLALDNVYRHLPPHHRITRFLPIASLLALALALAR